MNADRHGSLQQAFRATLLAGFIGVGLVLVIMSQASSPDYQAVLRYSTVISMLFLGLWLACERRFKSKLPRIFMNLYGVAIIVIISEFAYRVM